MFRNVTNGAKVILKLSEAVWNGSITRSPVIAVSYISLSDHVVGTEPGR